MYKLHLGSEVPVKKFHDHFSKDVKIVNGEIKVLNTKCTDFEKQQNRSSYYGIVT